MSPELRFLSEAKSNPNYIRAVVCFQQASTRLKISHRLNDTGMSVSSYFGKVTPGDSSHLSWLSLWSPVLGSGIQRSIVVWCWPLPALKGHVGVQANEILLRVSFVFPHPTPLKSSLTCGPLCRQSEDFLPFFSNPDSHPPYFSDILDAGDAPL